MIGMAGAVCAAALAVGCGGDEEGATAGTLPTDKPDLLAGSTAVVAILNPVANEGHNTGVPTQAGTAREMLTVDAEPGDQDVTEDGIAVVGVAPGNIDLRIGAASLPLTITAEGDVYDAPIAFDGAGAAFFANTPIRYPVGKTSGAIFFDPTSPFSDIEASLSTDDSVVVLGGGIYKGNLTIDGKGVLFFGEGFTEHDVIIEGSITANGEAVRLRGLTITGDLSSKGNNFGISFSLVKGTTSITGNAGAFVRNVFCGTTTVPSSNATLLDNFGIEPIKALPPMVCD